MAHTVVGMAGHIDHGKTLLVKALTGTDTDRAPEEKARGITIELGFAFLGDDVAIVDVPGHERFVKTMVAGVSAVDVALLVVAADDGIMPQSREHLDILDLLGVERGIIALNKIDLVEDEWLALVEEELREFARGTFLQDAPIVRVSAQSGAGIDALRTQLLDLTADTRALRSDAPFRMPVDRAFSVKGFGLVCTGTVVAGAIKEGAAVDILPAGRTARVRSVQTHGRAAPAVACGDRAAINLAGVEREEVQRGDVLVEAALFTSTHMIDVRLRLLESSPAALEQRTRVRLHVGTAEVLAGVVLLDCDELLPGEQALAQLRLEKPLCTAWGDRFVLRRYSPPLSIGGGSVLDPHPRKHRRADAAVCDQLRALEKGDVQGVVEALLRAAEDRLWTQQQLAANLALSPREIGDILADLQDSQRVLLRDVTGQRAALHAAVCGLWGERITDALTVFHREHPLRAGLRRAELCQRSAPYVQVELFDWVLDEMARQGRVEISASSVRLRGHEIEFDDAQNALRQRVEEAVRTRDWPALQDAAGLARTLATPARELDPVIGALQSLGVIVALEGGLLLHADIIGEARAVLGRYLQEREHITVSQYRDALDCNRKCAVALLIHFDGEGFTQRQGDVRVLCAPTR